MAARLAPRLGALLGLAVCVQAAGPAGPAALEETAASYAEPGRPLDAASTRCVFCHQETTGAPDPSGVPGGAAALASHPVGIAYEDAWARDPRMLRAWAEVTAAVPLPAGRVTCVSCHVPSSRDDPGALGGACPASSGLTLPMPELCRACHPL